MLSRHVTIVLGHDGEFDPIGPLRCFLCQSGTQLPGPDILQRYPWAFCPRSQVVVGTVNCRNAMFDVRFLFQWRPVALGVDGGVFLLLKYH